VQDLFDGKSLENTLRNQSLQYKIRAVLYNAGITTRLWKASCDAYRRGWHPVAWGIKLFNLLVFKAILPYECDIQDDLYLEHSGIGCAFAHFVTIGKRVTIGHHTAIASQNSRIIIEDDVKIGMHVIILGAASGGIRRIGRGATIGPRVRASCRCPRASSARPRRLRSSPRPNPRRNASGRLRAPSENYASGCRRACRRSRAARSGGR